MRRAGRLAAAAAIAVRKAQIWLAHLVPYCTTHARSVYDVSAHGCSSCVAERVAERAGAAATHCLPWHLIHQLRRKRLLAGIVMPVIMAFPPLLPVVGNF